MLGLFTKSYLYLKVYENEVEVTYLQENLTARRKSSRAFSTDRMLIAGFHAAEKHIKSVIEEVLTGRRFFHSSHVFLMQHMIDLGGGLCEVEKRTLRDIGEQAGGRAVFILPHTEPLSTEEAIHKLTMGMKGGAFMPPDLTW